MTERRFKNKPAFAACIARGLKPGEAARAVGVTRKTAYDWRRADPAFREMWDAALEERTEEAESQLYKLVQAGNLGAIMYALKHWHPEKYDRRVKLALGGDASMPPLAVHHSGKVRSNVHFYIPANGRDRPEVLDDRSPTIEGDAEPEKNDPA
jgi:hypothetical protein